MYDDLAGAVRRTQRCFATTALIVNLTKPVYSPEAQLAKAAQMISEAARAVLFRAEPQDLQNDDIFRANAIVIGDPGDPALPSFKSGTMCLFDGLTEWMRRKAMWFSEQVEMAGTNWAETADRTSRAAFENVLTQARFFMPDPSCQYEVHLRNMWSTLPLTRAD